MPSSLEMRMGMGTAGGATTPHPCASLATRPTQDKPGACTCMEFKIKTSKNLQKSTLHTPNRNLSGLKHRSWTSWVGKQLQDGRDGGSRDWGQDGNSELPHAKQKGEQHCDWQPALQTKGVYSHIKVSGSSPHLLDAYWNMMRPSCQQ